MSGQQIGTVIGGAIGAYFGGPAGAQLGMAIGGFVGGVVDPEHISGPKIGDGQQQSATDGAPIAWVQGAALIAGTIVQVSPRRQIRHKTGGKGGGPVQTTFTAEQDFAILVCESSELRGSSITSILMVFQDGKLVYDARPGSAIAESSAKWKANVDFLYGGEDQLPHPTLEAITGVGTTPAYRGSCLAVFKSFDVSAAGDRIPSFQFVVGSGAVQYNPDFAVDANLATVAPTPTNSITYACSTAATLSLQVLNGLTYGGWSRWPADDAPGVPGEGAWFCQVSVVNNDTGSVYRFFDNCRLTQAEALADAVAQGPVTLTGSTSWTIWCYDDVLNNRGGMSVAITLTDPADNDRTLSEVCDAVCLRGGLDSLDFDTTGLGSVSVAGYPIARQATAADCLRPLLQAYFAFGTEYDAKLYFKFYGEDAGLAVNSDDFLDGNDANEGAIKKDLRNQATEFPRRIVGSYMDPAQNYMTVTTAAERRSIDIVAIGDQSFEIPVVMAADEAAQAVDKALKVAYATLEGKLEYSVPFAGSDVYLRLAAGEPLIFNGKRWVADEAILSTGYLKLTTRYDRQSAYTSNVQAILGNAPATPTPRYSGLTKLVLMDLPAQRPQDTVGIYIAAAGASGQDGWYGCTLQVSYDSQASWQNALTIVSESVIGAVDINEPTGGEPLTVHVLKYALESVTFEQAAAGADVFAVVDSSQVAQLGQFKTATETTTALQFELTDTSRALGGVPSFSVSVGDDFTLMDAAYFLPIDPAFAGRTLYFRGVGFGEVAEDATVYSLLYTAKERAAGDSMLTEAGGYLTDEFGYAEISTE